MCLIWPETLKTRFLPTADQRLFLHKQKAGFLITKFLTLGAVACVWFIAWMFLVYKTPADDPRISKEEEDYIESTVGRKEVLGKCHV